MSKSVSRRSVAVDGIGLACLKEAKARPPWLPWRLNNTASQEEHSLHERASIVPCGLRMLPSRVG